METVLTDLPSRRASSRTFTPTAGSETVASAATGGLDQQSLTPEGLSLRGAFRLVLAIAAARENDRNQAYAYLDQARYSIDLATAHAMRRQIEEALRYLQIAEKLTPDQTRTQSPEQ